MSFEIYRGCEVFVFVIHLEAPALRIDGIALGSTLEGELFLLTQAAAVQDADRIVTRHRNPDFLCWRDIDNSVGS